MPPKSASKKQPAILWFFCENCKVTLVARDKEDHVKLCPIVANAPFTGSYLRDEAFFVTEVRAKAGVDELLKDVPAKLQNNLIFVSDAVLRLCRFVVGEHVAISSRESRDVVPLVRLVWPLPEKFLDTVLVSEEDFKTNWSPFKDLQLKIEKLTSDPIPADCLILKYADENVLEKGANDDLYKLLRCDLRSLVLCKGHNIKLNFYNKSLSLLVMDIKFPKIYSNEEGTLESRLQDLNLTDKNEKFGGYFLITNTTKFVIVENSVDDRSEANSNPGITANDIGGLDKIIDKIREPLNVALGFHQVPQGFKVGRGLMLFGPTGCGKSMICEALCNELKNVEIIKINSNEIFSKFFGETERNLQKEFDRALHRYPSPSLIVIEDMNNICPKHDSNDVVKRVSAAFLNMLDSLHLKSKAGRTFVLATTANIENLNPAVRRCGRIDVEVEVNVPDPEARYSILKKYLDKVDHSLNDNEIRNIAAVTHAFVGSDLANLISKSALGGLKSSSKKVTIEHINAALNHIKPSAMREVLIENPNVRWDEIGGQEDLKLKLKQAIEWPLLYPEKFQQLGIKPPRGILMFGPPGCSKTMIAKALATDSKVNFLSIKGPELFSMWVGESERAVREIFRKARQVAPAIIFFDEIDAIGGERSSESGSSVKERVLAQMLTELDGVDSLQNVTIVAATNRPDMIDKALMRPGRIDRIVYVGLPDVKTRQEIFAIKLKAMPLDRNVNIETLVKRTEGYSGAEIQAVCHEAALNALEQTIDADRVEWRHFEHSLALVQPRTSSSLLKLYDDYLKHS